MSTGFDIDRGLLYPDGGYGPNTWSNQQWFSGLFIRNKLSFAYYRTEFLFESSVYYTSTESLQIFLPGSSKCIKSVSFQPKNLQYLAGIFNISGRSRYPQVGGHLTTFKRITDLTISKRSRLESPGTKIHPRSVLTQPSLLEKRSFSTTGPADAEKRIPGFSARRAPVLAMNRWGAMVPMVGEFPPNGGDFLRDLSLKNTQKISGFGCFFLVCPDGWSWSGIFWVPQKKNWWVFCLVSWGFLLILFCFFLVEEVWNGLAEEVFNCSMVDEMTSDAIQTFRVVCWLFKKIVEPYLEDHPSQQSG